MKRLTLFIVLLSSLVSSAQDTEFGDSENGLIYSNSTISQLKKIVDSLNIKFRICTLNRTYFSKPQTRAHYIYLNSGNIKEARKDMETGLSYEKFILKYKKSSRDEDLLLIKEAYKNYENKDVIEFSNMGLKSGTEHTIYIDENISEYEKPMKGKWLISYWEGAEYSKESLSAFYVLEDFMQYAIPEKFARLIQYSDCMVDTSVDVFYDDAEKRGRGQVNKTTDKVRTFIDFIDLKTAMPRHPDRYGEENYEIYLEQKRIWKKMEFYRVDSIKRADPEFNKLLIAAANEAIETGGSHDRFEEFVADHHSKQIALELKRKRRVIGFCSQDDSPRYHAFSIALLSAETVNWEIFLRCHLNIMNDQFERNAESSAAKARRNTYIKELEVLDINVLDLLLGISLRFENANENHYYGSIDRVGRALAESKNPDEIESKLLEMISDCELDSYNRVLIYYLFLNYNDYVTDEKRVEANKKKIMEAVTSLPFYFTSKK